MNEDFKGKLGFLDEETLQGVFDVWLVVVGGAADTDQWFGRVTLPVLRDFLFSSQLSQFRNPKRMRIVNILFVAISLEDHQAKTQKRQQIT